MDWRRLSAHLPQRGWLLFVSPKTPRPLEGVGGAAMGVAITLDVRTF